MSDRNRPAAGLATLVVPLCAAGVGCVPPALPLLTPPEGASSVLVSLESGDSFSASAWRVAGPRIHHFGPRAFVFFFEQSLEDLGLEEGFVDSFEGSEALPDPAASWASEPDGAWRFIDPGQSRAFQEIRLSASDRVACAGRSACVTALGQPFCHPCPIPPEPDPPEPPAAAALPVLGPCPSGWSSEALGGVEVCSPVDPAPECDAHEYADPSTGCVHVGPECPSGLFPDSVSGSAVFVSSGAALGDGSREAPFADLDTALASAAPVIVLAAGSYEATLRIAARRLVGACVEETMLAAPLGIEGGSVESLTLSAGEVHIFGPTEISGVMLLGTTIVHEAVTVTRSLSSGQIWVEPGSTLTLRDSQSSAALHTFQASVDIERSRLARLVARGSELRIEASLLTRTLDIGGGHSTFVGSQLRGTDKATPYLKLSEGASAEVERLSGLRAAVEAFESRLSISDAFFDSGQDEQTIFYSSGSTVSVERATFRGGIRAMLVGKRSHVTVSDLRIGGIWVRPPDVDDAPSAIHVSSSELTVDRLGCSVAPTELDCIGTNASEITLRDLDADVGGVALKSLGNSIIRVERAKIRNAVGGIYLAGGGSGVISDLDAETKTRALHAARASVVVNRAKISGSSDGMLARDEDGAIVVTDLLVTNLTGEYCGSDDPCYGTAALCIAKAPCVFSRFRITGGNAGVVFSDNLGSSLEDGQITGSDVGALITGGSFDLDRVLTRVRFDGNREAIRWIR
ncbi:MAG: hypothetical protein HYV07_23720 [Deltaproteobacteria bacterium]|nr:hypothetical protein [Deltaproteobacteria bacterium]